MSAAFQVFDPRSEDSLRAVKPRRRYQRSTAGCTTCKSKRVKCDEVRPICSRCSRNHWRCAYTHTTYELEPTKLPRPTTTVIYALSGFPDLPASLKNGTTSRRLLHHLHTHADAVFGLPGMGFERMMGISHGQPMLQSTILAITACHMRHHSPDGTAHRISEHHHQSVALHSFQDMLQRSREGIGAPERDAAMMTGILLHVIAYALPTNQAEDEDSPMSSSWVVGGPRDDLSRWLSMQSGLRPLMAMLYGGQNNESLLLMARIFSCPWQKDSEGRMDLGVPVKAPASWARFFGLDVVGPDSACDGVGSDLTLSLLLRLAVTIRDMDPLPAGAYTAIGFATKIAPPIRDRLVRRDEKTTWLFGYWLGSLCRFGGTWWIAARARRDHAAVVAWLEGMRVEDGPGEEGEMWRERMAELRAVTLWVPRW